MGARSICRECGEGGLTIPSYIREAGIYAPQTRSRMRRTADADASMKLVAAMNRIGNLLNQAIKYLLFGNAPLLQEYKDALPSLHQAIAAVLAVYERRED
ncbi:MAG: hypothetical protein JO033_18485 [Acidobacteriaceae bacterium]|nr:hypothetical protein [Acidobacteriaceae bacterium]MBV9498463.1 hypothetical protein [Acidobacteriaceae bacterium]